MEAEVLKGAVICTPSLISTDQDGAFKTQIALQKGENPLHLRINKRKESYCYWEPCKVEWPNNAFAEEPFKYCDSQQHLKILSMLMRNSLARSNSYPKLEALNAEIRLPFARPNFYANLNGGGKRCGGHPTCEMIGGSIPINCRLTATGFVDVKKFQSLRLYP
ncbi:hypothetical protein JTE90_010460 [Oedothorax gibbosus]|uniref:Uncharacterized protein n=1 Tax=Oedothorax gibbosus TaxID=931172 RepID=A0AAV6W5B3_9ARAC|nr:hypothetical protein JTE90_010460 [Oedothorax gibbosus]